MMADTFEDRVAATTRLLLEGVERMNLNLAGDGSLCERDVEKLLGYCDRSLKAQRENGACPFPRRRVGNKWRYRLSEIANEIERTFCE